MEIGKKTDVWISEVCALFGKLMAAKTNSTNEVESR
jgi:hypothetical protein